MSEYVFPEVFQSFFDDAAVFPPGLAPLDVALSQHVARRRSPLASVVGPLVLPLHDLTKAKELAQYLDLSDGPVKVSVVTPPRLLKESLGNLVSAAPGLQIVAVELKTSAEELDWTRELLEAVQESSKCQIYVELTAQQIARGALELIAGTAVRLKVRTGGADESFFPTSAQLASVLSAAARERVPFKLTAGLHRAIRYTDRSTGITHHGFLNIAVATGLAELGASTAELQAVLSQTSAETVVQEFNAMESEWRQSFNSFGTCSISEPIETLEMVGVLLPGAMSLVLSTKKAATS